ncbi:DNA-binding protein [Burkholderia multivorans]|jgi:chromosome segregation ATPase|uniref:DNA-binding protein n=1 Tax=Burkholderia multivorans TaxID=87883 RepID=UPI0005807AE1|nr:DNA-binding protein [Burkholderia multivorans]KHS16095.1 ATPase [Burkholderia multivorans]KHS19848.1 ATPase [Burkholderia multivorans]MBR7921447.1 DNA-binding protein [Burkholderia multivorans]MBR8103678.1 DNA-binding protein [Burkholderia multivorans]MBR8336797.1 DNA-binding protein [Burkholderia multivorans]
MSDLTADESRLIAEIDRLKAAFPKTRELYREVCALLFFRFGITPTANRLYQLVRKGSMSTPTAVLGEFWAELREKSRVRIEHPDLPADLQAAAGELVATLWARSSADAAAALDALRAEVEAERAAAKTEVAALQSELARTETALEQRTAALLAAQVRIQELEQARAADDATRRAQQAEIERLKADNAEGARALAQARADFGTQLDRLRDDASRAEERLRASERRALQEIDRERQAAARLQKELDATNARADERDARLRREIGALQAQLADSQHRCGVLEGQLDGARAAQAASAAELDALRAERASAPRVTARRGPIRPVSAVRPTKPIARRRVPKPAGG